MYLIYVIITNKGLKMNEKIKMIFEKYQKLNLNIKEMSEVIGVSPSKTSKMFSDIGEKEILKQKILPKWRKVGGMRLWAIEEILSWNEQTELKAKVA